MTPDAIIARIHRSIPDAKVELQDLTGTGDHWKATVISESFRGKTTLARHRMVFAALATEMQGAIHALTLDAWTPEQAQARKR